MLAQVRGGVETMALRYHEALRRSGFEVLSLGHGDGMLSVLPPDEFRPVGAVTNHDPFAALRLRAVAREYRPDLVLTHGNRATGIALLPFLGTADRTVQVVHNFRHKNQITRVRAAICVSRSVCDDLKAARPGLPVYELANFGPLNERTVKAPPKGVPVLGTLGRLHVNKGLDIAIRAIALLKTKGVRVTLQIAGDGPEYQGLSALVAELGVSQEVEFIGWVTETADYLNSLDLFLLPSRVEPFGLVVTEAMAAGAPVVASAIDGPKEILLDGVLGSLSAPEDPQALATAIEAALGDWPATLNKARAARAYALTHFSLDAGAVRLKDTLEQIAQNHLPRGLKGVA